ncbi:MAG: CopD family protein [Sulfuricella sp.]|nr:CopD family protein [Sulfuricella sp.]
MGIALLLHILGVVVWVGGMFFAYMVLRPVVADLLDPPLRLALWAAVFRRFFPWVWLSLALIMSSGLYMIMILGGFAAVAWSVHLMFGIGLLMTFVFCFVYFVSYGKLVKVVAMHDWKQGGAVLATIRKLIGFNLSLGLVNIVVAAVSHMPV